MLTFNNYFSVDNFYLLFILLLNNLLTLNFHKVFIIVHIEFNNY